MIAQKISNIRQFTNLLFLQKTFDTFLVSEVTITTYNDFHIDGTLNRSFYNQEELTALGEEQFSSWRQLRPVCFSLIKGNKLPLSFKIVLRLSKDAISQLLLESGVVIPVEVNGLFLNILYKNNELTCVSGTSYEEFTMDRTMDQIWDKKVCHLLENLF